ncbi:hypothetical protein CEUSTIGMA_g10803.t1 [Chlamydomonas eustigma]|uniref:Uncharacterized protein n=1 Tax=Chlamydomonas eustigma TaxID=1157962 RepID=A0A250XJY2_9CHLO|nr:hypothetical protein CEUSTIGMA_g10803.t1 [Chlamydomonas eustigma]|eukprot:GAX83378.1 hypothetical protein CEUSTIGMA_g10803.t1 [Chlamydomonas eustigma]
MHNTSVQSAIMAADALEPLVPVRDAYYEPRRSLCNDMRDDQDLRMQQKAEHLAGELAAASALNSSVSSSILPWRQQGQEGTDLGLYHQAATIIQKYFRAFKSRHMLQALRAIAEEREQQRQQELNKQRSLLTRKLKQQAKDVLLALYAQGQYGRTRDRILLGKGLPQAQTCEESPAIDPLLWTAVMQLGLDPVQILISAGLSSKKLQLVLKASGHVTPTMCDLQLGGATENHPIRPVSISCCKSGSTCTAARSSMHGTTSTGLSSAMSLASEESGMSGFSVISLKDDIPSAALNTRYSGQQSKQRRHTEPALKIRELVENRQHSNSATGSSASATGSNTSGTLQVDQEVPEGTALQNDGSNCRQPLRHMVSTCNLDLKLLHVGQDPDILQVRQQQQQYLPPCRIVRRFESTPHPVPLELSSALSSDAVHSNQTCTNSSITAEMVNVRSTSEPGGAVTSKAPSSTSGTGGAVPSKVPRDSTLDSLAKANEIENVTSTKVTSEKSACNTSTPSPLVSSSSDASNAKPPSETLRVPAGCPGTKNSANIMITAASLPADLELQLVALGLPRRTVSLPTELLSSQTPLHVQPSSLKKSTNIDPKMHHGAIIPSWKSKAMNPSASKSILNGMPYSLKLPESKDVTPDAVYKSLLFPPLARGTQNSVLPSNEKNPVQDRNSSTSTNIISAGTNSKQHEWVERTEKLVPALRNRRHSTYGELSNRDDHQDHPKPNRHQVSLQEREDTVLHPAFQLYLSEVKKRNERKVESARASVGPKEAYDESGIKKTVAQRVGEGHAKRVTGLRSALQEMTLASGC